MKSIKTTLQVVVFVLVTGLMSTVLYSVKSAEDGAVTFQTLNRVETDAGLIAGTLQVGAAGVEVNQGLLDAWTRDADGAPTWAVFGPGGELMLGSPRSAEGLRQETAVLDALEARTLVRHAHRQLEIGSERARFTIAASRPKAELAKDMPLHDGFLDLWGIGLLPAAVLGIVIHRGFRPVRTATAELEAGKRISSDDMPEELKPFVVRLNELLDAREQALERERAFTGNVAHELRTPMAVLQTGLQVLGRRIDERHADTVGDLRETVDEMSTLVDNLLRLSRSERAKQGQPLRPAPLVASIWSRLQHEAEAKGLTFASNLTPDDEVHASEDGLRVILTNLLSNAVAYTEKGGHIVVDRPAGAVLAVWDSGPVPAPDRLERMFDRLWRADDARTEATQHAGLGLSIARSLAESMGLKLVAEVPATGGLRFVLR